MGHPTESKCVGEDGSFNSRTGLPTPYPVTYLLNDGRLEFR